MRTLVRGVRFNFRPPLRRRITRGNACRLGMTAFFPDCIAKSENTPAGPLRRDCDKKAPPGPSPADSEPRRRSPNPEEKGTWCFRIAAQIGHNAGMAQASNFKLALTRTIEPTARPGVELATLADAARFVALLRSWVRRDRIGTLRPSCY